MTKKDFMIPPDDTYVTPLGDIAFANNTDGAPTVKNAKYSPTSLQPPVSGNGMHNSEKNPHTAYTNNAAQNTQTEFAFTPNLLDNYDVFTYHWKLFMVPLSASASGKVLNTSIQSIIAESGVSDLTIDKVELQSVTTPSIESGTGTLTTVKFEIVEPSGAGLLDKMFYESIALGLGSWTVSPYYLQLEFRGRDPQSEATVIDGAAGGLGALRWVWPIKLTSSKINVTQVGTRYEFDAILYDELVQTNSYFAIQHNVTLRNLTTFGSAMIDLAKKLNDDCYEKLIDNYSIPDTYRIVVEPELAKTLLVNPNYNKNTSRASDFVDLSKKTAEFNTGTSIDKIVDSLLGSTWLGQVDILNSDTPSSTPKPSNEEKSQMKKLWRVVTESKPIAFDALRQNNANAFTVYIVRYDIGILDSNPSQTGQTPETLASMKKRLNEYMSKRILRKKYNYIFTGLNDQIIALDLNMNYAFAAATARFGGIYIDSGTNTKGVSQQDNIENEKKAGEIIRKTLQFINDASPDTNVDAKIAEAKKAIAATRVSPTVANRYASILDKSRLKDRAAFSKKLADAGGFSAGGIIGPTDALGNPIPAPKIGSLATAVSSSAGNLSFVSDVDIKSIGAQSARKIADSTRKGKLRPIPYMETSQEGNFIGIDPASDAGRARTSSMFATALYSSLDASMQSLKLTIKGDPFWLFPRNISKDATILPYKSEMNDTMAINEIKIAHIKNKDSVNILGTDNFIVIRFRTPRIFNEVDGSTDPFTEVDTFSGIYKVTRIISKFGAGRFTQDLEGILDPVINLSDLPEFKKLLNNIENTTKQLDETIPSNNIPLTSVKQDKLASNVNLVKGQDTATLESTPSRNLDKSNLPEVPVTSLLEFEKLKRGI